MYVDLLVKVSMCHRHWIYSHTTAWSNIVSLPSLHVGVRLFEWPPKGETSYLQGMQNIQPWSFPKLGWIRPWAICSNFRSGPTLNRDLDYMISKGIFQPALFHDSLLLHICGKGRSWNLILLVQQDLEQNKPYINSIIIFKSVSSHGIWASKVFSRFWNRSLRCFASYLS